MASAPRSQPKELSHRVTTAPMNDFEIDTIVDTQTGGVYGGPGGSLSIERPTEDK